MQPAEGMRLLQPKQASMLRTAPLAEKWQPQQSSAPSVSPSPHRPAENFAWRQENEDKKQLEKKKGTEQHLWKGFKTGQSV